MDLRKPKIEEDLTKFEILYEDLTFENAIGVGSYGEVWSGRLKNFPDVVAIKKLHATELDEQGMNIYYHEITSLALAPHSFIVPFIGFTKSAPYCIVTKHIPNDSLFNALREDPKGLKLTPTDLTVIAYGIAQGMAFLHSKGITHRDLKSQNILIDENKFPVICDFGSSRKATNSQPLKTAECGTPNYMAPEFMKGETYTNSVDVYSFGLILWEMMTCQLPFDNLQPAQVIFAVLIDHKRPPLPGNTPSFLGEVIASCWSDNPSERPPFNEILPHFENGDIMYEGCDREKFISIIQQFAREKKKKGKYVTLPRYVKKQGLNSQGYAISEVYRSEERLVKTTPFSCTNDLLNAYLIQLSDLKTKQVDVALNYLTAHVDDPALLRIPFWCHILDRLVNGPQNEFESINTLAVILAQSMPRLNLLSHVNNLEIYVGPQTLDVFLYIVTYTEQFVTLNVILELEKLCDDEQCMMKAFTLLSKILMLSSDEKNIENVTKFIQSRILGLVESPAGAVALRALVDHDAVTDEYIKAFLLSSNADCAISGYNALFVKDQRPNLLKVPTLLVHLTTDDEDLRGAAFEFVRRFALSVEGPVLAQILDALLTAVFRFSAENAVLLLCCFAADQQRSVSLLLPQISTIWLNSSPQKAIFMMRFFSVLFRNPVLRQKLMEIPEVPQFISTVLHSDNPETALAVCWVIGVVSDERDFLVKVNETEATEAIVGWLRLTREPRAVLSFTTALFAISECSYSSAFNLALPHLMTLVSENNSAALMCLKLMVSFSCYKETLNSFIDTNAFMVLGRYKPNDENERLIVKNIFDNLKKAGLVLPS